MVLTTNLSTSSFFFLFVALLASCMLTGSTLQWALNKGFLEKRLFEKSNQYNLLVVLASISSFIECLLGFINNVMYPDIRTWVIIWVVTNWIVMTNTSILLVSQRLSLTARRAETLWKRLLWINYIWFPISVWIAASWIIQRVDSSPILDQFIKIQQPIQIAILGIIEFSLSGYFIIKMWRFQWGSVERYSIIILIIVSFCDLSTIFMNLLIGDLYSMVIKGFVYSLRIRLEVNVLCTMVDYLKSRRGTGRLSITSREMIKIKNIDSFQYEKSEIRSNEKKETSNYQPYQQREIISTNINTDDEESRRISSRKIDNDGPDSTLNIDSNSPSQDVDTNSVSSLNIKSGNEID